MKNNFYLPVLFFATISLLSCNPECNLVSGLSIVPSFARANDQVIVTANPPSSLFDKKIFFDGKEMNAEPVSGRGMIVTVPNSSSGIIEVRISDPDCSQTTSFEVVENRFFINNPQFVFPSPPEIIFPITPNIPFPPSIDNAWLSPNDPDYCLWFVMEKDTINGEVIIKNAIDESRSMEQSTCFREDTTLYYNINQISGIIDRDKNIVNFWIDRRHKGLGIEEFEGQFIDINETGYTEWETKDADCIAEFAEEKKKRCHMIWVTSKATGRSLIIYQQAVKAEDIPCD